MNNNIFGTLYSLKGLFNQMSPCLHKHLHRYIVWDMTAVNERAYNFVFGIGSGWKANFYLFYTNVHKSIKHQQFFIKIHWLHKSLITITKVNTTPYGCFSDNFRWPLPVFDRHAGKRNVLFK